MLDASTTTLRFGRLLLTGAAGSLAQVLRPRLKAYCDTLRLSDQAAMASAAADEEVVVAALQDAQAVHDLLVDVDVVVHLGGVSTEQPWAPILADNTMGMVNLYEAARQQGVKRIVIDGMSDKQSSWWGNRHAKHLGFRPQDSSDAFRADTVARQPHIDSTDPVAIFQGGGFVKVALHGA